MARHVFFSFHYADIWRVNVVRNSHVVEGTAVAGFRDGSLWEEAKKKGDTAIKKMIDDSLEGTTVTCVLIGEKTSQREYVTYEIEKSIERGNGTAGFGTADNGSERSQAHDVGKRRALSAGHAGRQAPRRDLVPGRRQGGSRRAGFREQDAQGVHKELAGVGS